MKSTISMLLLTSTLISNCAFAWEEDENEEFPSYAGLELKNFWMKGRNDWQSLVKQKHHGLSFFYGLNFNDFLGLEFGYEYTSRTNRESILANNDVLFGINNNTGSNINAKAGVRLQAFYIDLMGYLPFKKWMNTERNHGLLFSLGAETTRMRIRTSTDAPDSNFAQGLIFKPRTSSLLRVGLGAQAIVTDNAGLRVFYRWKTASQLKGRGGVADLNQYKKVFHDQHSASVGVFYSF
ncbi:MAG: hypothetical protein JWM09_859 [Francisellaceae bacterium]|nr:hypothetical protein [Francisellaceae bacterium]